MNTTISIIVPAYNAEKTIEKTLMTICHQTYTDLEIIVIDDGSKDKTFDIVKSLAEQDHRIIAVRQNNAGPGAARNTGISTASGSYIMFADSDDEMRINAVERMYETASKMADTELVVCGFTINKEQGNTFELKPDAGSWEKDSYYVGIEMLQGKKCFNSLCNKLFLSRIIKENSIAIDTKLTMGEDYLFVVDYIHFMNGKLVAISDPLYQYNLSDGGLQSAYSSSEYMGRIQRAEALKTVYRDNNYPLSGIYNGLVGSFYTVLITAENPKMVLKDLYKTEQYKEICNNIDLIKGTKFKVFATLLKSRMTVIILALLTVFQRYKELNGTAMFERK